MPTAEMTPLLLLAVVLAAGMSAGALARRLHLPEVTGQILVGVGLAATRLPFLQVEHVDQLRPITAFALGLIAVTVGSHLNLRRLRNAYRRLLWLLVLEVLLTPPLVFVALTQLGGLDLNLSLLLAAMAVETAPATVIAVVRETHARGVFVKTLVAAVALNGMACIALFEVARVVTRVNLGAGAAPTWLELVLAPTRPLVFSTLLGVGIGALTVLGTRHTVRADRLASASLLAILLTSGLAEFLGISSLLACMVLGVTLANLTPDKDELGHGVFVDFEHAVHAAFFTLAGLELDVRVLLQGGGLGLLYVLARALGKQLSTRLAMRAAHATERVRAHLGLALLPQAGLSIGLILLVQGDPLFGDLHDLLLAVGLSAVTLNEVLGPLLVRRALHQAGDAGKDRARLIDFLHEENIAVGLRATSKEDAIRQLVDLLVRSNRLQVDRAALLRSVLEREQEFSTCLGEGLAIPHGVLETGDAIVGAMGISREGLAFDAPDGQPVHCMVLLATPPSRLEHHLEVLAALARAIGGDRHLQRQLYSARSAAHVCEILHAEEASEDFNYFLEDSAR